MSALKCLQNVKTVPPVSILMDLIDANALMDTKDLSANTVRPLPHLE